MRVGCEAQSWSWTTAAIVVCSDRVACLLAASRRIEKNVDCIASLRGASKAAAAAVAGRSGGGGGGGGGVV